MSVLIVKFPVAELPPSVQGPLTVRPNVAKLFPDDVALIVVLAAVAPIDT